MGTTRCDCPPLKGSADLSSGFAHAKTVAAQQSTLLLVSAIVALAINLRLSVNALGAALPTVRAELGLDGAAAGLLTASPPIVFAVAGIATPALAARLGTARTIALALVIAAAGQLVRLLGTGVESLFAGTLLALAGLAVGNVLLPGVIKEHFPERVAAYTAVYVTTMSVGAAIGSGLTIPVQQVLGGSWRAGFAVWAAVAVLAVLPWVVVAVRSPRSASAHRRPPVSVRALLSSGLAWAIAGFFAIQAASVYVALGWLGLVLQDAGLAAVSMGLLLAIPPAVGIGLSFVIPVLLREQRQIGPLMVGFALSYLLGYLGLLLAPGSAPWLWMSLIGLGGGTFPAALSLIPMRAGSPYAVITLSAFTQCVGYVLASLGPVAFGLLHDLDPSWRASLLLMIVSLVPMAIIGRRLARPRTVQIDAGRNPTTSLATVAR